VTYRPTVDGNGATQNITFFSLSSSEIRADNLEYFSASSCIFKNYYATHAGSLCLR